MKNMLVKTTQDRIAHEMEQQKQDIVRLNAKIQKWQNEVIKKHHQQSENQKKRNEQIIELKRKQAICLQTMKAKNKILPTLIKHANEQLIATYSENDGKVILQDIIKNLNVNGEA